MTKIAHFIDQVTLRMPNLFFRILFGFHKLLQNRTIATCTLGRASGRIMEMTTDFPFMFIVMVLRTKQDGAV